MHWITSGGGPLICLGQSVLGIWKGTDGLGEPEYKRQGFRSDYERACEVKDYLGIIPVMSSYGIVLGEMPLDTSIVISKEGLPLIVRAFYCEKDADVAGMISHDFNSQNEEEVECAEIRVCERNWQMFDSAYPGPEGLNNCLSFVIPVGDFNLATYEYKPDPSTFLLIHRFQYSSGVAE